MARLQQDRPVFHSERGLSTASRALWELVPDIRSRLEVRQNAPDAPGAEYLGLLCIEPSTGTAVEFAYVTAHWTGRLGSRGEGIRSGHSCALVKCPQSPRVFMVDQPDFAPVDAGPEWSTPAAGA